MMGFEKELGLHNAEMSTSPQPLSDHGLRAQLAEVRARLEAAENTAGVEGMRLVSDALWTIPPTGETARGYLTDSVDVDGVTVAVNMSDAVRYHAMANTGGDEHRGTVVKAPGVSSLAADTVMPESLTSIQPHYQVAQADTLPQHFRYALRIAGPSSRSASTPPSSRQTCTTRDGTANGSSRRARRRIGSTCSSPFSTRGPTRARSDFRGSSTTSRPRSTGSSPTRR